MLLCCLRFGPLFFSERLPPLCEEHSCPDHSVRTTKYTHRRNEPTTDDERRRAGEIGEKIPDDPEALSAKAHLKDANSEASITTVKHATERQGDDKE